MAKHGKVSPAAAVLDGTNGKHEDGASAVLKRHAMRVECPAEGAEIAGPFYTFQIATATAVDGVEVSVDQGGWMPCREALGLWWYDWSGFGAGEHELVVRTRVSDGIVISMAPRLFRVV